jgi:hypothetical protein
LRGNHAQIAVSGFCRMDKKGRAAGAGQGGGNLAAYMAGFAHAGNDDAAGAGQNGIDSA